MLLSVVLMCACVLVISRYIVCYNKDSVGASCPLQHAYFGVVTLDRDTLIVMMTVSQMVPFVCTVFL